MIQKPWLLLHGSAEVVSPTVEFLPFGPDWARVAKIRFSENKGLPDDNGLPRRQKVRNSTVELDTVSTITFDCIDLLQSVFSFLMLRVLMWETMVHLRLLDLIAQLNRSVRTTTVWRAEPPRS